MDEAKFKEAYNEPRNGANQFFRHPMMPLLEYSDGVKDCFEAGCYWLLDIISTECLAPARAHDKSPYLFTAEVAAGKALLTLTWSDTKPPIWSRNIDYTDLPAGRWVFELVDERSRFALTLISEH